MPIDLPSDLQELNDLLRYYLDIPSDSTNYVGFDSSALLDIHHTKNHIFIDKYLFTAIPDPQLITIFESMGIDSDKYSAWLDPKAPYWQALCLNDGYFSDFITPNIKGSKFNPYQRFRSSKTSGSEQLKKIIDLVGLNFTNIDPLVEKPVFNLITLTLPSEIDLSLVNDKLRSDIIKKIWVAFRLFFDRLHDYFGLSDNILGSSVSLHLWSSSGGFVPNAHLHLVLPHFSYYNITRDHRVDLEYSINRDSGDLSRPGNLYSQLYTEVLETTVTQYPFGRSKQNMDRLSMDGVSWLHRDGVLTSRTTGDQPTIDSIKRRISIALSDCLNFEVLPYRGSISYTKKNGIVSLYPVPLDREFIRQLWSECVSEIFDMSAICDIHLQFVTPDKKSQLMHYLSYKVRPPVLDLSLFFNNCPGFIVNHNVIDRKKALSFFTSQIFIAKNQDNTSNFDKYSSLLNKVTTLFARYSDTEILSWLRFLCLWKTTTKTFGFWRNISRYRVESIHEKPLPSCPVCPICGGECANFRFVKQFDLDFIVILHGSRFHLFPVDKPPPPTWISDLNV